jgi:hypothetical protein
MRGLSPAKLLSAAVSGLLLIPLAGATPAAAVELVTPYPAVAAEPGRTATFDLQIVSDVREPVSLRVTEVPDGWHTVLRGDGREVEAAFATPDEPAEVQLEVRVPPDAEAGRHTVTITGEADSGSATLPAPPASTSRPTRRRTPPPGRTRSASAPVARPGTSTPP